LKTKIKVQTHAKQNEIVKNRNRFNVIRCGRRFGKSYLAFVLALESMLEVSSARVLYTAPTYSDLRKRYRDAQQLFQPLGAVCKEGQIKLGDSYLEFTGVWRSESIRGNAYHRTICDEWAYATNGEEAWQDVIRPTLADYEGDAYFFSTPAGRNHFYDLDRMQETYSTWKSFHFTSYDNPHIKSSEIDLAKEQLPSLAFAQEYLAEYVDRGASKIKREWIKVAPDTDSLDYYIGVDLAISQKETADYTAIVVIGSSPDGSVSVVEAIRGRWTFVEIGQKIIAAYDKWNPRVVSVESNQAQTWMVQELKRNTRMNVVGVRADRDKVVRFQPVEARYEQGLIYHVPHLNPDFVEELLNFTGTPQDKHDDFVDALAHAFNSIRKSPSIYV
jgi:predicted phage terminase large subunit-like protein